MNLLDRTIAHVAPIYGARRAQARAVLRSYDGATTGRRGASFKANGESANTAIGPALARLRNRSSDLIRNTWLGARIVDVLVAHAVGTGITVSWETDRAQRLWNEWCGNADIEGERDFATDQVIAVRSMLERGDAGIRMLARSIDDDRAVPFALQIAEGDIIDESRNGVYDGRRVRLGVVLGDFDARLGYYVHPSHPGEMQFVGALTSSFVERSDYCHLYRPLRAGQVRGVPLLAPVIMGMRDYADLMDAMVVKLRMEACYGLAITSNQAATGVGAAAVDKDERGRPIERMSPGMIYRGMPGDTITAINPSGSGQFEPVALSALMGIASGGMVTYDQATGDLRQANYSSLRAGKIEFKRLVEQLQWTCLVPFMMNRIVRQWKKLALMSGRLRDRKQGYEHTYVMPAWEPIDPLKDMQADILAVRAGRMSPQEFIGAWGRDWRVVVKEIGEFWKVDPDLVLDIDPRRVDRSGAWQAQPATDQPQPTQSKDK